MQKQIKSINTLEELQALYTATFGKNGTMTARLKQMKDMDNDARAALNRENTELRDGESVPNNEDVVKTLLNIKNSDFKSVISNITIDKEGNIDSPAVLKRINNGKPVVVEK